MLFFKLPSQIQYYRDRITSFNKLFAMVNVFNFRSDILWPLCTQINIIYLHFSYDAEFQKCYMEKMRLKVGFPYFWSNIMCKYFHSYSQGRSSVPPNIALMNLFKGWIHWYSENPPYAHLSNTVTSLLRPLFFGHLAKTTIHFLVKKRSLIRPPRWYGKFFWPIGDHINGVPL